MSEYRMVRVETEVYAMLLALKHELERERLRQVSLSETIRSALERTKTPSRRRRRP